MLWEVEIRPAKGEIDREAARVLAEAGGTGAASVTSVAAARSYLVEGDVSEAADDVVELLADPVVESSAVHRVGVGALPRASTAGSS
ncbi:MAG: hypothetical protein U0992_15260 [Planctomycetaceae bacterium]